MYEAKNFEHLLGTPGFSDQLLRDHFTLYQGYVKNVNIARQTLDDLLQQDTQTTPAFAEIKRRFGWEFNGMRLHELYFENMTKVSPSLNTASAFAKKITEFFSTENAWRKDFQASGVMRGIGWVILYFDGISGKLFNVWVNEHDMGHLVGCTPLLVLDVFEHAYIRDYGIKRPDYIAAFWQAIDWSVVQKRFERAFSL